MGGGEEQFLELSDLIQRGEHQAFPCVPCQPRSPERGMNKGKELEALWGK